MIALVALVVIGPKDLPKAMRVVGYWVGRARGVGRQFRAGFDEMVRESELAEMEKKWAAENERIMREHAPDVPSSEPLSPSDTLTAGGSKIGASPASRDHSTFNDADLVDDYTEQSQVMVERPQIIPAAFNEDDSADGISNSKAKS